MDGWIHHANDVSLNAITCFCDFLLENGGCRKLLGWLLLAVALGENPDLLYFSGNVSSYFLHLTA